jgi:dimethylargininase
MFTKAIVRKPGKNIVKGLTTAGLGEPNYAKACAQHAAYVSALEKCGLNVQNLDADERFPDSVFIEDPALVTKRFALVTRPGDPTRLDEAASMKEVLKEIYADVKEIHAPGTLEGGDIMMAGEHFYIGLSARTNRCGAEQAISMLEQFGFSGSVIKQNELLHLKTGISYLENETMISVDRLCSHPRFKKYHMIDIPEEESYAANCVWINGTVLVPMGYPVTLQKIRDEMP